MNTGANNQQQGAVTYLMVTEAQLRQIAEDSAKSVLEQFGISGNEVRDKLTVDDKDEYRPLVYWMGKMHVNRSTLWRWQKDGLITPKYVGKKLFFRQRDFDEMFTQREAATK